MTQRLYPRVLLSAVGLLVVQLGLLPTAAVAQTLDAPEQICLREGNISVEWTGPNGDDDLITIAYTQAAPDVFVDSHRTSDGTPATLRLPLLPGTYEIRYIQGRPLAVLARRTIVVAQCQQLSGGESCPLPTYPPESFAVVVHGVQSESGEQYPAQQGFTLEQLCSTGDALAPMLGDLLSRVQVPLNVPADVIRNNVSNQLQNMRNTVCPAESSGTEYFFTITYAHCRMAMETIPNSMDIHLPPGSAEGTMSMADHAEREIVQLSLERNIDAVSEFTGTGWGNTIEMRSTGRSGSHAGFATREYEFEYGGGLGIPGLGALTEAEVAGGGITGPRAFGNLVSVRNEGTAWIADCIPGIDIVQTFYENLSREVQPDQGAASFLSGLINNLVGMLDRGIPLEIEQTVSSAIAGRTMGSGASHAVITGFDVIPLPPAWCSASLMPSEGYTIVDVDQQISDAMSSAAGGGGNTAPGGLNEAMQQLNEAMQQLTPEQRQMMEQFGGALGGLGGLQQPPTANRAAPAAPARTRPTSEELYSDDLTQMVQNHLQALGYDPGNTDGDLSVQTTIAISQFQAETGLEVTGEVTPQLAGILAAEVDR